MGLEFLQQLGARRMRDYQAQPMLLNGMFRGAANDEEDHDDASGEEDEKAGPDVDLEYESAPASWQPIRVSECGKWNDLDDFPLRPRRFIDGKDVGRTVAWLQTEEGFPVPVRLSVIGAIAMKNEDGELKREWHQVQRVVTMALDCFPNVDAGAWAESLAEHDFRLLNVPVPPEGLGYDFEKTNGRTRARSRYEMNTLEKRAMQIDNSTPMLVDGRLDQHGGAFDAQTTPVLGLIKSHRQQYFANDLHCWKTLYELEPGQRTPAFILHNPLGNYVSWYLRMCGTNGELPNYGLVRLELPAPFFESLARDFSCIDRLSQLVCEYRCRDESYGRAAVSIHPVVRAEESLGALFTPLDTLAHKFYRLTAL